MQHLTSLAKYTRSIVNTFTAGYHATQKPFVDITTKQLIDTQHISRILNTNIPKKSRRSQKGLFHGKEIKSGNYYTDSRQARRRFWKPNTIDKELYSEILGRKIQIEITTKTLRCMRKYGGFDNYVLLTKPAKMDSLYGEYLRTLMMTKLKEPEFRVPYLVKSKPFDGKSSSTNHRYARRPVLFHPKDIRYTDLTKDRVKTISEMNKKELALFKELEYMSGSFQDMQTNHPLVKEVEEERDRQVELLEVDRQRVVAEFDRKPSKKQKQKILELFEEEEFEF